MNRFKTSTAFQDLLFNMLLGFVFLFMVALLLINPVTKKSDAPKKAEFLITIEWDDKSWDDIDLWVRSPTGGIVAFNQRNTGNMHLERDDLGRMTDSRNGVAILSNEETVTLRGIEAGEYEVMAHVYRTRKGGDRYIKAQLMKINPYSIKYTGKVEYKQDGQMISLFRFTLDKDGNVIDMNNLPSSFIPIRTGAGAA